jgi:glycosyltransferase involved in cell wall biosynthesis
MSNLDLSIIIPLYNAEHYIQDCLSSLVSQNIDPGRYEIIVIDDGSKDNGLKVAKDFALKYPNVRIIEQENQGVGAARNTGIDRARGAYIYFIDSDDYLAHNTLNKVLNDALERDLEMLYFQAWGTNVRNLFSSKNLDTYQIDSHVYTGPDFVVNYLTANCIWRVVVKKDLILRNNLYFRKEHYEGVIFELELISVAEKVSSTNLDVYRYYENPKSILHNKDEAHYNKFIKDLKYAIIKMDELIGKIASRSGNMDKCIEKLKFQQHRAIFILLARGIKSSIEFKAFKDYVNDLKKAKLYPITHYPGLARVTLYRKMSLYIFNRPFLLLPFTYTVKTLKNLGKYLLNPKAK